MISGGEQHKHLRRGREERARRQRLADRRATRSDKGLERLRHRTEEALAADGVARSRLGSEVLVRLKVDDLAELREAVQALAQHGRVAPVIVHQRIDFAASMVDGRTAGEVNARSRSAEEITALWKYIKTQLRQ